MTTNIDWSKAPEGAMGFHPQANGYVDHWVKWTENGDNWFCTCGFEAGGWVEYHVSLNQMSPRYRSAIVVRPVDPFLAPICWSGVNDTLANCYCLLCA